MYIVLPDLKQNELELVSTIDAYAYISHIEYGQTKVNDDFICTVYVLYMFISTSLFKFT